MKIIMKIILLLVGVITTVKGSYYQEILGNFYVTPAIQDVYKEPENTYRKSDLIDTEYDNIFRKSEVIYKEQDSYYGNSGGIHIEQDSYYGKVYGSHPCGTDLHTCVPNAHCNEHSYSGAKICPPSFEKFGGACYYISNDRLVKKQSRPQALKFCEALGGNLVNFESREEFNELSTRIPSGTSHWTEGFYKPYTSSWLWETSKEEINFKFVHPETAQNEGIKDPDNHCLSFNDAGLYETYCFEALPFVCKEGHYKNNCERYGTNKCCFTPSYDYYINNQHTAHNQNYRTTSPCFVTYNTQTITCANAYKSLQKIPAKNFRFENSIYYVMPANEGCGRDIEAIISTNDLHTFIVRILTSRYLSSLDIKLRIGLHGTETTTRIEFKWANGKSIDFYEGTYWALGHPQLQSKAECVMYELTGEDGTYLWHTQEDEAVCNGQYNFVLCQLPIRSHDYQPNLRKEEGCGERKNKGVLGRSYSFTSSEQTSVGELPWQVAISVSGTYYGGVGLNFACSGVLISYDSLITSAHCAIQAGENMVLSLGDYDLQGQNRRKLLYPEYRTVAESIIHPGYRRWNPGYGPGRNDIAILRLSEAVKYNDFPHIGISCLPTHNLLYGSGDWECYVSGWPKKNVYDHTQVITRIEADFTSRQECFTAKSKLSTGTQYGHSSYYGPRQFGSSQSNLLCVEAAESNSCIEDNTAILICKKRQEYLDDPFGLDFYDDYRVPGGQYGSPGGQYGSPGGQYGSPGGQYGSPGGHYGSPGGQYGSPGGQYGSPGGQYGSPGGQYGPPLPGGQYGSPGGRYGSSGGRYGSHSLTFRQQWQSGTTRIINSYVQERSDNDRWYLMGIGHGSNRCDLSSEIMLFEPVHEHIAFIHANVDLVEKD